jgi:hypothetical protein
MLKGTPVVKWTGKDADDDSLLYTVLYSKDAKKTWTALATGLKTTSYKLKTNKLAGSKNAYIRIMATDGVNTTVVDSKQPFIIANKKTT